MKKIFFGYPVVETRLTASLRHLLQFTVFSVLIYGIFVVICRIGLIKDNPITRDAINRVSTWIIKSR